MKEVVIIGAPGAGKSTLMALFLANLKDAVFVDGHVDIPLLKYFFQGREQERRPFKVQVPIRNFMLCASCGLCAKNCPLKAIYEEDLWIDPLECEGCGYCAYQCPQRALEMANMQVGEIIREEKDSQTLLYGQLMPGALGGPLLIEALREEARRTNKSALLAEAPGLGESTWRLWEGAQQALLVLSPDTEAEIFFRIQALPVKEKYIVFNKSGLDPQRERDLLTKAQDLGFRPFAQIPWKETLAQGLTPEALKGLNISLSLP